MKRVTLSMPRINVTPESTSNIYRLVWVLRGEHQFLLNCLKIVQLARDLMRFMFRGGTLAKVTSFKKLPQIVSQSSMRGRIQEQTSHFPQFLLLCFVFFFKDQIQRAFYAFCHWINNGISTPLEKSFILWQTCAPFGAHPGRCGFGPSVRRVRAGWFLCCAPPPLKLYLWQRLWSLSKEIRAHSSPRRNVKLDICVRKQSTKHKPALKGGSCPAGLLTFGKTAFSKWALEKAVIS